MPAMDINHIPFFSVTISALVVHVVSFIIATSVGGSWMHEWSKLMQTARLFTVQRREVQSPLCWRMVIVARTALIIAIVSFVLDLFINPSEA